MVVGNGMLATRFASYKERSDTLIFASGVSNSKNTQPSAFHRELSLLLEQLKAFQGGRFTYFSTCSIYDPEEKDNAYVKHKLDCEALIAERATDYIIFRVSNVVGRSANPNTVLNYFYYHLAKGLNFDLWVNAWRNLLDADDMFVIADQLLKQKECNREIINIANTESYNVRTIVSEMERVLGLEGNYVPIEKGQAFDIDVSRVEPVIRKSGINFDDNYLTRLIEKYYTKA